MAADARIAELTPARVHLLAGVRLGPAQAVGLIVTASAIGRAFTSWLRDTPIYFPDEYIYSEIGRSIAEHGRPLVRGSSAHFPALLQPLLTAPAWLFDDVATSFRVIQTLNAVVMSLAAVAVFWLARRLGLGAWLSVGMAAFAVAIPDMFYAAWLLADPFAYPLVLGAIGAATAAFARPTRRTQIAFVVLAGLATLARVQFVVLPACFILATVGIGLRERRVRAAFAEQRLVFGLFALALLPLVDAGPQAILGYYENVLNLDLTPGPILKWAGADGMLMLYSSGWVLAPGALLGLAYAMGRPRSRAELAFGLFALLFSIATIFQAALYAANGAERIQERYFFYLLPLIALLFGLYATRGFPHRVPHALVAGGILALSARVPLAGFSAAEGKSNSPLLLAVGTLETHVGAVGLASLYVAVAVALLSGVAAAAGFFPRHAAAPLMALAIGAMIVPSVGSVSFGHQAASNVYDTVLWPDASYVDHAGLGKVALLEVPMNDRGFATEQLFWNRSLDRVLLLPGAIPPDAFKADQVVIGPDGSLLVENKPFAGPLLVDAFSATSEFRGARQVARTRIYRLFAPAGRPRLSLYMPGRYFDGWLGLHGSLQLWPNSGETLAGRLSMTFTLPPALAAVTVTFKHEGKTTEVRVRPGSPALLNLPICSAGSWSATFSAPLTTHLGARLVSVRATKPVLTPDATAC
ncbi:MAG: hypothetical protein ABI649_00655 [Gaiellaceae bacterium]